MNFANEITAYENGELTAYEIVCLFGKLIKTGIIWHLQGHYQRAAERFLNEGFLTVQGDLGPCGRRLRNDEN